ncbi:DUF3592 domain-containing protein [Auraticoccus sp. F435]|uniref:DUF3592 domain-containing protein n=1 Tax=Auraticoccus cholistanensis TaxID=2656650 RepID=A0A6A9UWA7_9ACTN|nr:DUF3592 domain-containing protein [Auraticoccus cholistanensis]MVA75864.1 DUF3592 domain-containing protein [Auraticoccus cholistanensis]
MRPVTELLLGFGGGACLLGLVFWTVGFAVGKGRRSGWRSTQGRWVPFEGRWSRSWQVEYRAEDGSTHRVFPSMDALGLTQSGTVPVRYDPRRPRRAVIDTFYHRGGFFKVVGGVVVGIGLLLAGLAALLSRG